MSLLYNKTDLKYYGTNMGTDMNKLPVDCLAEILRRLSVCTRSDAFLVNHVWRRIIQQLITSDYTSWKLESEEVSKKTRARRFFDACQNGDYLIIIHAFKQTKGQINNEYWKNKGLKYTVRGTAKCWQSRGHLCLINWFKKYQQVDMYHAWLGACCVGNISLFYRIINQTDIASSSHNWLEGAMKGAKYGQFKVVKYLINNKTNFENSAVSGLYLENFLYNILYKACKSGSYKLFRLIWLLPHLYPDAINLNPISWAAAKGGNLDILREVMFAYVDPEPILCGGCIGGHLEIVKLAIFRGAKDFTKALSLCHKHERKECAAYITSL